MKKFIAFFLGLAVLFAATTTAYASDIQPCSNNVDRVRTTLIISDSGVATVKNIYYGIKGITQSAKIVTKIQKKVGVIWVTVSDGSWTDNSTATSYSKSHSVQLSSKGTYRAHVVFIISGSGGSDDKITKNSENTYS